MAVLLVDVGFGDLHSTKDPAMDLYIIQMSKLILQSAERIFLLMDRNKISQAELSRRTGISVKNISDWKRKKTNPNAESLLPICNALDITPNQLLTGKGIDPEYQQSDFDDEITGTDMKLLKQIHNLGDVQYKRLIVYVKALQKLEAMESIVEE